MVLEGFVCNENSDCASPKSMSMLSFALKLCRKLFGFFA
jgi:hypothetical protein